MYKSYVKERRKKDEAYYDMRVAYKRNQEQAMTSDSREIRVVVETKVAKKLTQKELKENKAEKNMFYMAFTFCSMSIVSRVLYFLNVFYFTSFNSFANYLILNITVVSIWAYLYFIRLIKCFVKNL